MPLEKTFPLQSSDVLHHRGLAGETQMLLNLARARRDSLPSLLGLNELENVLLPDSEHVNMWR